MADPVDVTRDAKPMPLGGLDPNVKMPPTVARQIAAAEQLHQAAYTAPAEPQPEPQPQPTPAPAPAPVTATVTEQQPAPAADPVADPDAPPADGQPVNWEHRYRSMEGRFKNAQKTITSMQETMQQMGDTLLQMQTPQPAPAKTHSSAPPKPLVTDKDREAYGDELIDLAARVAQQAVSPQLEALKAENARLTKQVANKAQRDFYGQLDEAFPEWRQLNSDKRFLDWLRLPDFYSGRVRQTLLNEAFHAANAAWALRFFKGFQSEAAASSGAEPVTVAQPAASAPARQAATTLEALASPGRPKPAGSGQLPSADDGKPVFTRAQISEFYGNVRRGVYRGNEAEKARIENAIFAAQREGRVRG